MLSLTQVDFLNEQLALKEEELKKVTRQNTDISALKLECAHR